MGRGGSGHFNGTKGSQNTIYSGGNKKDALGSVSSMPKEIQNSVKKFFKGSSNNYNSYSVSQNTDGTYTIKMINPGRVPGSKAVYNKIVDSSGKTLKVFKDTFDPEGKLVHRKEK